MASVQDAPVSGKTVRQRDFIAKVKAKKSGLDPATLNTKEPSGMLTAEEAALWEVFQTLNGQRKIDVNGYPVSLTFSETVTGVTFYLDDEEWNKTYVRIILKLDAAYVLAEIDRINKLKKREQGRKGRRGG